MKIRNVVFFAAAAVLSGCSAFQSEKDSSFIAATFNVRLKNTKDPSPNTWAERAPRCRELIRKNQIDIMGLQEPLADQLKDLFDGSEYNVIGGGRNDFKQSGEFSCIAYRRDRFECLKNGTFGLSEQPEKPGVRSWESRCPRIATWGLFRDRRTGKKFVYYNTHLDHISELARCNGIKLLVEHAKKNVAGKPLMISGDFNATPATETYRTAQSLLRDSKLVSETPHTGPDKTFNKWGKPVRNEHAPIDYIFVSQEFRVQSHRTDDTLIDGHFCSDHYPVVVKLTLK